MDTRSQLAPLGPEFSRMICGYWRLMEWGMSPEQLLVFIEQHIELGITTADHADIYGGYQCEQAFGQALRLKPSLRDQLELVSKCGIATTAKPEHALGHYITDSSHIITSAEQSLAHLHTDYLDLLLIHRPDPLMDADEVAEAFTQLHQSGKVKHFGVSNFIGNRMKKLSQMALASVLALSGLSVSAQTLLNASYDVAREFYKDYNA
ncbi:MAG: aldo/keto reductase, partial [Yersinia sp. (in: enterobacteria)]